MTCMVTDEENWRNKMKAIHIKNPFSRATRKQRTHIYCNDAEVAAQEISMEFFERIQTRLRSAGVHVYNHNQCTCRVKLVELHNYDYSSCSFSVSIDI